ncbi:MAG: hypothetical protein WD077_02275 [Bacteroidia bacterium]
MEIFYYSGSGMLFCNYRKRAISWLPGAFQYLFYVSLPVFRLINQENPYIRNFNLRSMEHHNLRKGDFPEPHKHFLSLTP